MSIYRILEILSGGSEIGPLGAYDSYYGSFAGFKVLSDLDVCRREGLETGFCKLLVIK